MPFANLAPILLAALGEPLAITLHRYGAGTQNQTTGHFVEGTSTDTALSAVVNPYDRKANPAREGEKPGGVWIELFTAAPLRDARTPNVQADEITYIGERWRIMECDNWTLTAGYAYSKAMLIGVD